jgi:rhomboid protease GluP
MSSYPPPSSYPAQPPEISPPERAAQPGELPQGAEGIPGEVAGAGPRPKADARSWAYAPATYVLVGINCAVYLGMLLRGVSLMNPSAEQLFHWGATHPAAVLYGGEWYRVVSAMFVHVGLIHLLTNMWCLWNLGLLGEPLLGPFGIVAAYVLCGAAGNLLSVGVNMAQNHPSVVGAGASGAVFGLAGVLIVLLKSPRLPVAPGELNSLRRNVIYFAAINFIIGFGSSQVNLGVNIDNMAHLGGFLCGLLFALPLVPRVGSPRPLFLLRRRLAMGMVSAVLVFFGFFLSVVFGAPPLTVR